MVAYEKQASQSVKNLNHKGTKSTKILDARFWMLDGVYSFSQNWEKVGMRARSEIRFWFQGGDSEISTVES